MLALSLTIASCGPCMAAPDFVEMTTPPEPPRVENVNTAPWIEDIKKERDEAKAEPCMAAPAFAEAMEATTTPAPTVPEGDRPSGNEALVTISVLGLAGCCGGLLGWLGSIDRRQRHGPHSFSTRRRQLDDEMIAESPMQVAHLLSQVVVLRAEYRHEYCGNLYTAMGAAMPVCPPVTGPAMVGIRRIMSQSQRGRIELVELQFTEGIDEIVFNPAQAAPQTQERP